jgi:hypothetical protein
VLESWSEGVLKNKNRGYQQLRVWQDAVEFYRLTSHVFRKLPYELKRVGSQAIAASDSVHRNIARDIVESRSVNISIS